MDYVSVYSFNNYIDANIMLGRMKDAGVECWLKNEATTTIIPIWTTALGGIQLMVEETDLGQAAVLLQQIKDEKKQAHSCPKCGGYNVEFINTMRKPINWLSAAVTFFLGDVALMPEQRFHCFTCGCEFQQAEEEKE